jgi:ribosome-interacting GTPase 1
MPTNLPPEAAAAEKRYKEATAVPEKLERLEEFLRLIPKHKGTDKLRAGLRKRSSKLKEQIQAGKKAGGGARGADAAWRVDREGCGQVALIGPPNVGKSALLAALTKASPEVADYPWTTRTPIPGMMLFENVQIQLLDTPPLTGEHLQPELIDLIRRADVMLLTVDLQTDAIGQLEEAVALLAERKIVPAARRPEEPERGVVYLPLLVLVNKCDDEAGDGDYEVFCELLEGDWLLLAVSAREQRNLDQLRRRVYEMLGIMRVYSKPPGRKADLTSPFTLDVGGTVAEFAATVHRDLQQQLKTARLWGAGVFDGQTVSRDHVLHEGDVVEVRV